MSEENDTVSPLDLLLAAQKRIEQLEQALADAKRDTERLDWLEQHRALLNYSDYGAHVAVPSGQDQEEPHIHYHEKDYRASIDAAMQTEEQKR